MTRSVLAADGQTYRPFVEANDVFGGGWKPLYAPLVAHWLRFVRGAIERREAAHELVVAIGTPP